MILKVAIIIVTWNGKEDCLTCLSSLRNLVPPRPSIILVDNGSTDDTVEVITERFPEVTIITSPSNLGFAGGNNLGIERALTEGADYVCLLNNDTAVDPHFLEELLRFAAADPRAGILGSRILYYDRPDMIWSYGIAVNRISGRIYTTYNNRKDSEISGVITQVDAVSGAAMLLKREMLQEVGLLDEDYYLYFEDVDLCLRARRMGYKIVTVSSSRVRHKVSGSMGGGVFTDDGLLRYPEPPLDWEKAASGFRLLSVGSEYYDLARYIYICGFHLGRSMCIQDPGLAAGSC